MSLLTLVQGACARLGLERPITVVGNTNEIASDMYYLSTQNAKALSRRAAWKALTAEQTFTTVAQAVQTSAVPTDCDWIIPQTMFNRTRNRRVNGPLSPEEWQTIQASLTSMIDPCFRIRGTSLLFTPTPAAGDTAAFEYITKNFCASSGGTAQSAWAADTDTTVLDEELHIIGLVWRFKRAKGLDYTQELADYELEIRQALMREGVRPRISTDPAGYGSDVDVSMPRPNAIITDSGDYIVWD